MSKEELETIAFDLFQNLWNQGGKESASSTVKPYCDKVQAGKDGNSKIIGKWSLCMQGDDMRGSLTICEGINRAELSSPNVDVEELRLKSAECTKTLVYEGDADQWDNCEDSFNVNLTVEYDPVNDIIEGCVNVSPLHNDEYGPPSASGGDFNFVGLRGDDKAPSSVIRAKSSRLEG
eukprot:CAMPEP_0194353650 /NCGR_PEP_ID=MMETSP0174-20130528/1944_1 /TAXON_ID=216777 /ORGANISM="Proboscia alata, Strain PI-D3" /LENGTH=176 /DNA_ID=CAMNT_0039122293 /DNA_START=99 /DNA_END=629 /DNA_ORIENTATION=+